MEIGDIFRYDGNLYLCISIYIYMHICNTRIFEEAKNSSKWSCRTPQINQQTAAIERIRFGIQQPQGTTTGN